jgi:endonuclease YncB( thermonuclease family)
MVGRLLILLSIFAFCSLSTFPQSSPERSSVPRKTLEINKSTDGNLTPPVIEGRVTDVEDGDTITVQGADGTIYPVRLQAIDAPEFKQDNFKNSKKSLSALVLNKDVKVIVVTKDADGRQIGTVLLDGRDIGLIQLEKGMAWHYKRFAYEQTPEARKQYADAQAKAQAETVGIWDEKRPIPPWVFRGDVMTVAPTSNSRTITPANPRPDRKYILGPMGGCYYLADDGHKVYVKDKSRCAATATETKPQ